MDSPSRPPVPAFGAWRDNGPGSPSIDYAQAFAMARASRMGSTPAREESRDYENYSFHYQPEGEFRPTESDSLPAPRSPRRLFQFFVCGARRSQAVS
ncbi:hypothetical protein R1flu_018041 [Riccia fluitans]|uniref:Uncharacterized protein n=1 Tax=Riccia fluitans TaxID=41844 RepID=A0ABD1ZEN9_9MARC